MSNPSAPYEIHVANVNTSPRRDVPSILTYPYLLDSAWHALVICDAYRAA